MDWFDKQGLFDDLSASFYRDQPDHQKKDVGADVGEPAAESNQAHDSSASEKSDAWSAASLFDEFSLDFYQSVASSSSTDVPQADSESEEAPADSLLDADGGFGGSIDFSLTKGSVLEGMTVVPIPVDDSLDVQQAPITNELIRKGDLILETYEVTSDALSGNMGSVWRVHHREWDMELAMKRPQPRFFAEASARRKENFIEECRNWINLGLHPNIVSCYYVREVGGVPTIFSEWVDGGSLDEAINKHTLYDGTSEEVVERILDIAIQTARGLAYSHECGLVHQDVKPANIMIGTDWEPKVADFGLARAASRVSEEGGVQLSKGYSPAYCPREQAEGAAVEPWMDLFAWSLTVLEMLLGERTWSLGAELEDGFDIDCNRFLAKVPHELVSLLESFLERCTKNFNDVEEELQSIYHKVTGHAYLRAKPEAAADTAESLNNRALSFLDLGNRDMALELIDEAADANPNCLEAAFNRAALRWEEGLSDDVSMRDRIAAVSVGDDEEKQLAKRRLEAFVQEKRGAKPQEAIDFRYREGMDDLEGGTVLASSRSVHDFRLVNNSYAVLMCAIGVSKDDDSWFHYAIGEHPPAPTEPVLWNLDDDVAKPWPFDDTPALPDAFEAPAELLDRALGRGWVTGDPTCSAISPDGSLLAIGFLGKLCLVEAQTGRRIRTCSYHLGWPVLRVAFSSAAERVYSCLSTDGVTSTWGLFSWEVPEFDWSFPRKICRAQSVKVRADLQEAFDRAVASFARLKEAGRYKQAAEAIYEAESISGFEHDPEVARMYTELAAEAIPIGVTDFSTLFTVERVNREPGIQMTPDGRYAAFTNGKIWNLQDNRLVYEGDSHTMPWGFSEDGKRCALARSGFGGASGSDVIVVDLQTGDVLGTGSEVGLDGIRNMRPKPYRGTRSPSAMLPDGVVAAVAEMYVELDACCIDFINTQTGERIARRKTYWDPMWDLMPKDIAVSQDGRHFLYVFQGNSRTFGVYCEVKWEYEEQSVPARQRARQYEQQRAEQERERVIASAREEVSRIERAIQEKYRENEDIPLSKFKQRVRLGMEIAELQEELKEAKKEYERLMALD